MRQWWVTDSAAHRATQLFTTVVSREASECTTNQTCRWTDGKNQETESGSSGSPDLPMDTRNMWHGRGRLKLFPWKWHWVQSLDFRALSHQVTRCTSNSTKEVVSPMPSVHLSICPSVHLSDCLVVELPQNPQIDSCRNKLALGRCVRLTIWYLDIKQSSFNWSLYWLINPPKV